MKVKIDEDACTGCGLCVDTCPEVFDMGDAVAVVKGDVVPEGAEESCQEAIDSCPIECIIVVS